MIPLFSMRPTGLLTQRRPEAINGCISCHGGLMQKACTTFACTLVLLLTLSTDVCAKTRSKPLVFTTIAPHAYMVKRVGGDRVEVETMIPAGSSPHSFEPTAGQIARVANATAYFKSGIEAEETLLPKISNLNKGLKFFDINRGIELRRIEGDHDHGHSGMADPHVWLSPRLAKKEAENIYAGLVSIDPANEEEYKRNLDSFLRELDQLNEYIAKRLKPVRGRALYVYHPSFGYFADEYGLRQVAVEVGGKEPGAKRIATMIENAKRDGVTAIFIEPQFSAKQAELIAKSIGGNVVVIDPLSENYVVNLREISLRISNTLEAEGKRR